MNLAKQLSVGTIDEEADFLSAYLKEAAQEERIDAMYADAIDRIKGELQKP
jgi:hypothetical protein